METFMIMTDLLEVKLLICFRDPSKDALVMNVPNVPRDTPVTFVLVYDELLDKTQGVYKQKINVNPGQVKP